MSSYNSIGGYFALEQSPPKRVLHDDAIFLNSARACFEYILRAQNIRHIYIPKYTCDVLLEPLVKLSIPYTFYSVNISLELENIIQLDEGDFIIYTNYFGIKDKYCDHLSTVYGSQLILDCSQAYYYPPPKTSHTFYSPRKFFGVPDGGLLYTKLKLKDKFEVDTSFNRFSHLIKNIDLGPEAGYKDFKNNEASLIMQPIKQMSKLTRLLLGNIDYNYAKNKRLDNYSYLHKKLSQTNLLEQQLLEVKAPMVYPYLPKNEISKHNLLSNKIYVATYWPNVISWCGGKEIENMLARRLIPLPIDQRYGLKEMKRLIGFMNGN